MHIFIHWRLFCIHTLTLFFTQYYIVSNIVQSVVTP